MVKGLPMSQHHILSGCRRATSIAYTDIGCGEETVHFVCIKAMSPVWVTCLILFVQLELHAQVANLLLLQFTKTLLAPAVTDSNQHPKDEIDQTPLALEMGNDLGPAPFFHKRPLHQIGGAPIVLIALWDGEVIETGLGTIKQTATRCGQLPLILRYDRLAALLGFLRGRGIAHIDQHRFDLGPEMHRDFLLRILHLVQPTATP